MADTYEKDLSQKTTLTGADFLRVVGTDTVSYKDTIRDIGGALFGGITFDTEAETGDDADLYAAITALGWSDCIETVASAE